MSDAQYTLPAGLFVNREKIHERPIELGDGTKHMLYFREVTLAELRRYRQDEGSEDETVRLNAIARLIAQSLVTPDGQPALSYEQATMLKPRVSDRMTSEIMKLNDFKKQEEEAKKPSPPEAPTGSGTS